MVFNQGSAKVEDCEFWGNGRNLNIHEGCEILHRGILER